MDVVNAIIHARAVVIRYKNGYGKIDEIITELRLGGENVGPLRTYHAKYAARNC